MALFQLVIASLSVFSLCVETKVVNTFDECKEFFYKESHPNAFDQNNYAKICQKYNNHYHFATLYSKQDRIPVYSAYKLNFHCRQSAGRQATWFIEPQLSDFNEDDMRTQNNDGDTIKMKQAIPAFYSDTNYDRGHLNPNSYQHEYGRHATFTLTNAVPMDACFNRMQWKQYEDEMKRMVLSLYGTGTPYFVTGAVPSEEKIPVPVLDSTESERDFNMVTVPRYVWTAFCFHATDEEDSFSLGYIGENKPEAVIYPKSIDELNTSLQDLYNMPDFRVFTDHCFASNSLSKRNLNSLIQFQVKQIAKSGAYDSFSKKAQNKISAVYKRRRESSHPPMNSMVLDLMVKMDYVNMPQWFENNEMLKHHSSVSCVFKTDIPTFHPPCHIELRSANNYDLSCALVSEKSTLGSDITADGTRCMKGETCSGSCNTEKGVKLCCTTPCLYNENGASFMCSSGSQTIKCSPQYSQVTETGKPCKPDHECGTYGEDYYWCYIYGKEWERCISPFKPETLTTGGNSNGAPCKFPFIYNGKEYYHCTTDDAETRRLWCATVSNYDQDAKWGYCPLSGIVTVGGNDPGKECVFPFYYEGRHYFRCTTKNNNRIPWCATTSDYPRDNKWGNCPFTGPPTTGGNSNGASCKFPFKYNDKDYYYCTTDNAETKQLWCATVSNYAQDPKWGYCPTSGIVTVGGNDPGKECVFPFSYDKQMYFECTTINNNRIPWCATTSDYPQDNKWGNCPFTGPPTTGGNSNGAPCKFPFKYNDKDYYYCTTDNAETKQLWCATVSNYAQDPKWGYCRTSSIFTVGGNDPGRECVFPFYYEEKMYFECTLKNSDKGSWCATTSDYPKDSKWGYCV